MAKYDPDRIADLAAGSLDPSEAAALEAEIATDPEASAELAAQRFALEAVRRAPAPMLSAEERSELRRAVAEALHLEAPRPVQAVAAGRRVPWRPLAVAAAALVALVAAVPLFGLLSVGDEEAAVTTIALEATTTAGAVELNAAEDGDQNPPAEGLGAVTTTGAATTLATMNPAARDLAAASKAVQELIADPASLFASAPAGVVPCRDEARILLEAAAPTGRRVALSGTDLVVWFLASAETTLQRLVAFDPVSCEFLAAYP